MSSSAFLDGKLHQLQNLIKRDPGAYIGKSATSPPQVFIENCDKRMACSDAVSDYDTYGTVHTVWMPYIEWIDVCVLRFFTTNYLSVC